MPNIKPISDLRNYSEVLRDVALAAVMTLIFVLPFLFSMPISLCTGVLWDFIHSVQSIPAYIPVLCSAQEPEPPTHTDFHTQRRIPAS